jgi:gas vesicle protein
MQIIRATLVAVMLSATASGPATASPETCRNAINQYNSAISDISSALRRYANCVSSSEGRDDCSSEFRRLRSAQSDFESAVLQYGSECN